jgi:hypothetical protein|tara:strand:- start:458 stop:703 length:246 start_codon:yes stop_codon:yes gene_type:complete
MEEYKLDDEVISQIAKMLQVAILTGTDVVDNLRTVRVRVDEESDRIILGSEYKAEVDSQIEKMLEFANKSSETNSEDRSAD